MDKTDTDAKAPGDGTQPGSDTSEGTDTGQDDNAGSDKREKTVSQSEFDGATARLRKEKRDAEKALNAQIAELTEQVNALSSQVSDRDKADLSDAERARLERDEAAKKAATEAEARKAAERELMRYRVFATKAQGIPEVILEGVTGESEEELEAAIDERRKVWDQIQLDALLGLPELTPEQLQERFGDAAQPVIEKIEKLKGKPSTLGLGPGALGATAAVPGDQKSRREVLEFLASPEGQKLPPHERRRRWVAATAPSSAE